MPVKSSDRCREAGRVNVTETQDRHHWTRLTDRQRDHRKQHSCQWGSMTLVWGFQHPGSKCVWRVTGLSDHSLVCTHRGSSESKGAPDLLLFLCSWVHSSPGERKAYASPWLWPWAVLLLWVEWDSVAWPFLQKRHGWCSKATKLMAVLLPKQRGIAKFRLVWGLPFPQPEPVDGCLSDCECTRRVGRLEHEDLVTNWKSHSSFHLYCLWKTVGGCL